MSESETNSKVETTLGTEPSSTEPKVQKDESVVETPSTHTSATENTDDTTSKSVESSEKKENDDVDVDVDVDSTQTETKPKLEKEEKENNIQSEPKVQESTSTSSNDNNNNNNTSATSTVSDSKEEQQQQPNKEESKEKEKESVSSDSTTQNVPSSSSSSTSTSTSTSSSEGESTPKPTTTSTPSTATPATTTAAPASTPASTPAPATSSTPTTTVSTSSSAKNRSTSSNNTSSSSNKSSSTTTNKDKSSSSSSSSRDTANSTNVKRAPASSSSSQSTSTTAPATTTTTNKLEDSNQKKQQTTTSSTTPSSTSTPTSTSTSTSSPASSAALIPTAPTTPTTHFTHSLLHLINPQLPHEKRTRILVVNDVRGRLALLNELAKAENADYVISTGNFGFFDDTSYQTIREDELRDRMVKISRIPADKHHIGNLSAPELRNYGKTNHILSDLPLFLRKEKTLTVPVYTVWGRHEDVHVVEKFRNNELSLANLFILDERHTYKVESLRLFGLGGSITHNKFFDTGSGRSTIAGENGKMWTTLLQIGELLKLAHQTRDEPLKPQIQKVLFSKTESTHSSIDPVPITRLFVSHVGAGIEPLVAQIAYELKANVTVSGNIHSIYCSSYTDSSVTSAEQHSCRLAATTASILAFWDQVKESVLGACSQEEAVLFDSVLKMLDRHKSVIDGDDSWKTLIHHVVPNWEVGYMVFGLDYKGRIASDSYSDGRDAGASRKKPHYDTRRRDYGRYGNYHGKDSYSNSNYRSSSGSSSSGKDYSHGKTQNASGGKYSSTSTSTSTSSQASSSNSTSSSKSTERASSKSSESLTVFIKPILGRTKEQEIVSFFDKCKIDRVYLQTYYNSDDASYAHVRFQDAESVKEALKMNGKEFKGQKLTVEMPHSHDSKRSDGHQKYTKPTTSK